MVTFFFAVFPPPPFWNPRGGGPKYIFNPPSPPRKNVHYIFGGPPLKLGVKGVGIWSRQNLWEGYYCLFFFGGGSRFTVVHHPPPYPTFIIMWYHKCLAGFAHGDTPALYSTIWRQCRSACHQMFVAWLASSIQQQRMAKKSTFMLGNILKKLLLQKDFDLVTAPPSFPGAYFQHMVIAKFYRFTVANFPMENLGPG